MSLPQDPVILLSYVNTQLRDFYPTLAELCSALNLDAVQLQKKLADIGYEYDSASNQFK